MYLRRPLLCLGLLATALVHAATFTTTSSETHPLSRNGKVRIQNANGSISIRTWDRAEVSIQVEKVGSSEEFLEAIDVEITSEPDSISITTSKPKSEWDWHDLLDWNWGRDRQGQVRLTLMVPAMAQLDRIALVNGSIALEETHGLVNVSTVNGSIRATGLHEGALKTVNGSIQAGVDQLATTTQLTVATVNGSVTIRLPKAVGASVNLATINGGISCNLPLETETDVSRTRLIGVLGSGDGSIRVKCINGGVRLESL